MKLKKAFFEESSSTNDIMKMIENCLQKIISLTNDSINENNNDKEQKEIKEIQNQSLSLMLNFIIELLQMIPTQYSEELCKALDNKITYAAISYWEQEKRSPSLDCCIILADFFNVTLDYLAGREE